MDVDRGKKRDRTYFVCRKRGHMAKNYQQRKRRKRRVVEILQESAKKSGEQ